MLTSRIVVPFLADVTQFVEPLGMIWMAGPITVLDLVKGTGIGTSPLIAPTAKIQVKALIPSSI